MRGQVTPTLADRDGENDNSAAGSNPALPHWDQWRCIAVTSRARKPVRGEVFVRARTRQIAERCGREAFALQGVKGRLVINAFPYYPWLDRRISSFVRQVRDGQ